MTQLALDLSAGRRRRDDGIARALDAERRDWIDRALRALREFMRGRETFTIEQFRYDFLAAGNPEPHVPEVWGAFTNAARKSGLIVPTGDYRKAASPGTHAHPVALWRAA